MLGTAQPSDSLRPLRVTARLAMPALREAALARQFGAHSSDLNAALALSFARLGSPCDLSTASFNELSNGGCYVAAPSVDPSVGALTQPGTDHVLSADAAGVVATLIALNELTARSETVWTEHYYSLLEFVRSHPERAAIGTAFLHYV